MMYNIAFLYKSLHFTVAVRTGKSWAAVFQSWLCQEIGLGDNLRRMFSGEKKKKKTSKCVWPESGNG